MTLLIRAIPAMLLVLMASFAQAQSNDAFNLQRWKAEGWKTDFDKRSVAISSIRSGGPPKDGIPPLDDPKFVTIAEATHLADREPVIGIELNGDARAYPLQVLMWHEIANDVVGGTPVVVTYCPLCNAALVFDARLDGKSLDFGTTGKLRNSDLVMYDRATESWWQQFTGEAIMGAMTGKSLRFLPARLESLAQFKARHPDGKVLVPNDPTMRNYGRNPYVGYDTSARPFLYDGALPDGIDPMARVVVVRADGAPAMVVTMDTVRRTGTLERDGIRLSWSAGQASALGDARIANGADVGTIIAERVSDGRAEPVVYDVTFAFVAHAFHPEIAIIK